MNTRCFIDVTINIHRKVPTVPTVPWGGTYGTVGTVGTYWYGTSKYRTAYTGGTMPLGVPS